MVSSLSLVVLLVVVLVMVLPWKGVSLQQCNLLSLE